MLILLYAEKEEYAVKISYNSNKMEKVLCDEQLIKKEYGKMAQKVMNRMSELRAATSLADISCTPPPRRHKLEPHSKNHWGIDISKNFRIVVEAVGEFDENDLSSIQEVKILYLEDYH